MSLLGLRHNGAYYLRHISLDEHQHARLLSVDLAHRVLMRAAYALAQAINNFQYERDVGRGEMITFWLEMCCMLPENITAVLEQAERVCGILGSNYILINHSQQETVHFNRLYLPRYAIMALAVRVA